MTDEDEPEFQGAFPVEPDIHEPHRGGNRDTPSRWLLQSWRDVRYVFTEPKISQLKQKVKKDLSMSDEDAEVYFQILQTSIKNINWKRAMEEELARERDAAKEETSRLFKMRLGKALKYSVEHQPPISVSPLLAGLSDNILKKLAELHNVKPPTRRSNDKDAVFLLTVADWAAKLMNNIYYQMKVVEKEDSCMKLVHEVSSKLSMTDWESCDSEEMEEEETAQTAKEETTAEDDSVNSVTDLTTEEVDYERRDSDDDDDDDEPGYELSSYADDSELTKSAWDLEKNFKRIFAGLEPGFRSNTPVMESSVKLGPHSRHRVSIVAKPASFDEDQLRKIEPSAMQLLSKPSRVDHASVRKMLSSVTILDDATDDDDDDDSEDDDDSDPDDDPTTIQETKSVDTSQKNTTTPGTSQRYPLSSMHTSQRTQETSQRTQETSQRTQETSQRSQDTSQSTTQETSHRAHDTSQRTGKSTEETSLRTQETSQRGQETTLRSDKSTQPTQESTEQTTQETSPGFEDSEQTAYVDKEIQKKHVNLDVSDSTSWVEMTSDTFSVHTDDYFRQLPSKK